MGSDQSKLKGLEIKETVETTDFWTLHNAEIPNEDGENQLLSIFKEESVVAGQLWVAQSPLKRAIKNLMIFRHPYILKYITSWDQGSHKHLAVKRIQPLQMVMPTQSDIQICLGLRNILCCLIFLIEQAKARHLNICTSSIYVTIDGEWLLGGFEQVWKSKDLSKTIFDLAKSYRYKPAINPHETKSNNSDGLEQYAFAVLCEEILKRSKNIDTPYVTEFRDYCATHLKHRNVQMRPKLSAILLHPYFNHEFILIHSFLTELPLKSPQEKQDFFTGLIDRLRYFDENVVASQVGNLLLSRMVLLDTTAQLCVTPYVLKTKTDITSALFAVSTFSKYIIPRIKQIFCVRDSQIRLILLEYFNEYVKLLTKEELQEQILPNLLLGIKDTNDLLVAKTLRCLADLVPILGSAMVIGGNRCRLFADGRPQGLPDIKSNWIEPPRSITPVLLTSSGEYIDSSSPIPDHVDISESLVSTIIDPVNLLDCKNINNNGISMPERLSPDGGEDVQQTPNGTDVEADGDEPWSDWENDDLRLPIISTQSDTLITLQKENPPIPIINPIQAIKTISDDINDLDIKIQKIPSATEHEEFDYFKDMEPVFPAITNNIEDLLKNRQTVMTTATDTIEKSEKVNEPIQVDKTRFEFHIQDEHAVDEAGWDDVDNDWT